MTAAPCAGSRDRRGSSARTGRSQTRYRVWSGCPEEGVAMTHTCCPDCRLRVSRAAAAAFEACPSCDKPLQVLDADAIVGFALWVLPAPSPAEAAMRAVLVDRP